MIIKGSQRRGGRALAAHLLNLRDNDHVEVHGIEGFTAADVKGAFVEIEAMSRATRCKQPFFSVSISPPKGETVVEADYENAIAQVATTLGLSDQPRVILFHEKKARRHCHVVFSRIDPVEVKAINLPFFKRRLTEVSRELYLSHGFQMPKGLADKSLANPLNFSLEEWQVARRAKRDPREIKAALKQCWERSDSAAAFAAAMRDRGFWLARGDRRGFVALDYKGTVYSLSRWLEVRPKDLKNRLNEPVCHASVERAKADIDATLDSAAQRLLGDMERREDAAIKPLIDQHQRIVGRQRGERKELRRKQQVRCEALALDHAQRIRGGLKGLWDWVSGRRKETRRAVRAEAEQAAAYDDTERHGLRLQHRCERETLQVKIEAQRLHSTNERSRLNDVVKEGARPDYRVTLPEPDRTRLRPDEVRRRHHGKEHSL